VLIRTEQAALVPWWTDPAWRAIPWTCPRCGTTTPGTPAVGELCRDSGFRRQGK
jgi:hypothetical protein